MKNEVYYDKSKPFIDDEVFIELYDSGRVDEVKDKHILNRLYFGTEKNREEGRFHDTVTTIFEVLGRYFIVDWDEGRTESYEDEVFGTPKEIFKKEKDVLIPEQIIPEHVEHRVWFENEDGKIW